MTVLLPPAGGQTTKVNRKNVLVINSDAQDNIYLDGNPVVVSEIADILKQRIEENDKLIISIESHSESHYQTMIDILDEVKRAKAKAFSIKMFAG
jgi:biopolymer transport protein ExbD